MAADISKVLRTIANRHADTDEGIACEGTALERITVRARTKSFLFLGGGEAMLKLRESLPAATKLAESEPDRYTVGASGWVKVKLGPGREPSLPLLERWIAESYQLIVGPSAKLRGRRGDRG